MRRQIILGMGAGQCGLMLLAQILQKQANAKITHEQPPLLPWNREPGAPGIRERLRRILDTTSERFVGDVSSFYLPYVEDAIQFDPEIRIVCLKRPREEVLTGFCRHLDQAPYPINHWAQEPAPGWWHDPFWSRVFPQYDTQDREAGIRRYWEEYYAAADDLMRRYPNNLRVYDTEVLTAEPGVREVLSFVGIAQGDQVIITGQRPAPDAGQAPAPARPRYPHPMDPRKCVILVPFSGFIHQECEDALKELERRGYPVRRVGGYAAIDQGRNQMATDALRDGFEETLWIDSDVCFHPDSIERLRSHPHPIVCGVYPQKGKRALACHVMPGAPSLVFGQRGGLTEILYAGAGFLLVRREAYLAIQRKLKLPMCNERFGHSMIPFFYPMIRTIEEAYWYLAEDYAFCERARQCGLKIHADTSIRLWHVGTYRYGWEDAGIERQRFGTFTLNFGSAPGTPQATPTQEHPALANFAAEYPWPAEKPNVPPFPDGEGRVAEIQQAMASLVAPTTRLVVEAGAWTGRSTCLLANVAPHATIIAVDAWQDHSEPEQTAETAPGLSRLYETFLSECWDFRHRVVAVRLPLAEGLERVAEAGLEPDLVYFNAQHREGLAKDLSSALDLFPKAVVGGDGFDQPWLRDVVETLMTERGVAYEARGAAWTILRSAPPFGR